MKPTPLLVITGIALLFFPACREPVKSCTDVCPEYMVPVYPQVEEPDECECRCPSIEAFGDSCQYTLPGFARTFRNSQNFSCLFSGVFGPPPKVYVEFSDTLAQVFNLFNDTTCLEFTAQLSFPSGQTAPWHYLIVMTPTPSSIVMIDGEAYELLGSMQIEPLLTVQLPDLTMGNLVLKHVSSGQEYNASDCTTWQLRASGTICDNSGTWNGLECKCDCPVGWAGILCDSMISGGGGGDTAILGSYIRTDSLVAGNEIFSDVTTITWDATNEWYLIDNFYQAGFAMPFDYDQGVVQITTYTDGADCYEVLDGSVVFGPTDIEVDYKRYDCSIPIDATYFKSRLIRQ